MKLFDIMTAPWAIVPEKLREIQGVYETHLRGEKIDLKGLEARMGEPLQKQDQGYEVINGTAVIPIDGVISRRMNMLQKISGGASTELIERDVKAALNDTSVERILLEIDSPGGSVSGIFELANMIYNARGDKPIESISVGTMASASYLIGAAAEKVYISGETDTIGSIGVIYTHLDKSSAQEKAGVKTTEIFAGKYKAISSSNKPLSKEGQQDIQSKVDYIYTLFVEHVAKFRGVSVDAVLNDMADGKVFIGKQAIEAGLVDGVSTVDHLVAPKPSGSSGGFITAQSGDDMSTKKIKGLEVKSMNDIEKLKAENPELVASIEAGAREGYVLQVDVDAQISEAEEKGGLAQIERAKGVFAHYRPGREKLVAELMFDGKTTADAAAGRILAAEDKVKSKALEDINADAQAAGAMPPAEPGSNMPTGENLPIEEKCKAAWEKDAVLQAEFAGNFDAYLAYERARANGSAKILKR